MLSLSSNGKTVQGNPAKVNISISEHPRKVARLASATVVAIDPRPFTPIDYSPSLRVKYSLDYNSIGTQKLPPDLPSAGIGLGNS